MSCHLKPFIYSESCHFLPNFSGGECPVIWIPSSILILAISCATSQEVNVLSSESLHLFWFSLFPAQFLRLWVSCHLNPFIHFESMTKDFSFHNTVITGNHHSNNSTGRRVSGTKDFSFINMVITNSQVLNHSNNSHGRRVSGTNTWQKIWGFASWRDVILSLLCCVGNNNMGINKIMLYAMYQYIYEDISPN